MLEGSPFANLSAGTVRRAVPGPQWTASFFLTSLFIGQLFGWFIKLIWELLDGFVVRYPIIAIYDPINGIMIPFGLTENIAIFDAINGLMIPISPRQHLYRI